jgi:hypothetical protein
MKKNLFFLLLLSYLNTAAQEAITDKYPFKTAVKLNLNGLKIGLEQRLYKNLTAQFEVGYIGTKATILKPQIRLYKKLFNDQSAYIGLAYLYKHQETTYNDSIISKNNNGEYIKYTKDFTVNKYIHAITINGGYYYNTYIFKQKCLFEVNFGLGLRYKKSSRYGLLLNEDIDLSEAMFIRPARYLETNGAFKIYPELNYNFSLVIPIWK